jgi:deaminated glutathione amidase
MTGASARIACIQMRSGTNEAANIEALREMVREAAADGAKFVLTPEMTGLVARSKELFAQISPDDRNPVFAAASKLAADLGIWLHIGSTAVLSGEGRAVNRAAMFAPNGDRVATYDKIHMFDVDLDNGESWRESATYDAGDTGVVVYGPPVPVGMAICYDLRFAELFRSEALAGAEMLTCPACFTRQTGEAHWHALLRARAIENGAYVVAAAQGGLHEDGRQTYGHSLVYDPWGRLVAELDHDQPAILACEIDPALPSMMRRKIPVLGHVRDFSIRVEGVSVQAGEAAA